MLAGCELILAKNHFQVSVVKPVHLQYNTNKLLSSTVIEFSNGSSLCFKQIRKLQNEPFLIRWITSFEVKYFIKFTNIELNKGKIDCYYYPITLLQVSSTQLLRHTIRPAHKAKGNLFNPDLGLGICYIYSYCGRGPSLTNKGDASLPPPHGERSQS